MRPSLYGEPYAITRRLIEDGRKHLMLEDGLDVPARCASCRATPTRTCPPPMP